jgi:hypothetical protein
MKKNKRVQNRFFISNKKAIGMEFNWIFAILAGTVILFIAIYATSKLIGGGEQKIYTETASKIETLLSPMGTGLASGKSAQINFKKDTRTYYTCSDLGQFGKQTIAFSEKTFGDYGEKGGQINTQKYIFAKSVEEGKTLYLFSKPFEMPFKIDDVIIISSENFCFYQAPEEIKDEINGLNIKNIQFTDNLKNCTGTSVCFGVSGCEVNVFGLCEGYNCESIYDYGKVIKEGKSFYYDGALMYGAIMSSPEIYECNAKRLMKKLIELSNVYNDKANIIKSKGCDSDTGADLSSMISLARDTNSSNQLFSVSQKAEAIQLKNMGAGCKLW